MRLDYINHLGKKCTADGNNSDFELVSITKDNRTTVTLTAKKDIELEEAEEIIPFNANYDDLYFFNGYQSWTDTKEFMMSERMRDIRKSPHIIAHMFAMNRYGDSTFFNYSMKKMHGYDIFYSKGEYESFIYSMNYKTAYLIIYILAGKKDLHLVSAVNGIKLKKGESITIYDYYMFFNFVEGLESFKKVYPENIPEKLFGYTSINIYGKLPLPKRDLGK